MACFGDSQNYVAAKGSGFAVVVRGTALQDSFNNPLPISQSAAEQLYNASGGPGPCSGGTSTGTTTNSGGTTTTGASTQQQASAATASITGKLASFLSGSTAGLPNFAWIGGALAGVLVLKKRR